MSRAKTIRKEARELLRVAKLAYKFIRDHPSGLEEDREEILRDLLEVIDRADPPEFDEGETSIKLTMTNATADTILSTLAERASVSDEDARTHEVFARSLRRTRQRAYATLDLNFVVLRKLHYVLTHTKATYQDKAFSRLAGEVAEGLKKNPMEIIGRMGL